MSFEITIKTDDIELIKYLYDNATVNESSNDPRGDLLFHAIKNRDFELLKWLAKKNSEDKIVWNCNESYDNLVGHLLYLKDIKMLKFLAKNDFFYLQDILNDILISDQKDDEFRSKLITFILQHWKNERFYNTYIFEWAIKTNNYGIFKLAYKTQFPRKDICLFYSYTQNRIFNDMKLFLMRIQPFLIYTRTFLQFSNRKTEKVAIRKGLIRPKKRTWEHLK